MGSDLLLSQARDGLFHLLFYSYFYKTGWGRDLDGGGVSEPVAAWIEEWEASQPEDAGVHLFISLSITRARLVFVCGCMVLLSYDFAIQ